MNDITNYFTGCFFLFLLDLFTFDIDCLEGLLKAVNMILVEPLELSRIQHLNATRFGRERVVAVIRVLSLSCSFLELLVDVWEVLGNIAEVLTF